MSDIDQLVNEFVTGTTPRENWSQVRNRYVQTRDLVRSAHADMKAAIALLKNPPTAPGEGEPIETTLFNYL